MKSATISTEEIKKSDGLILSPNFYLTFKPLIKEYIKEKATKEHLRVNTDWVDTIDYGSAQVLYTLMKQNKGLEQLKEMIECHLKESLKD